MHAISFISNLWPLARPQSELPSQIYPAKLPKLPGGWLSLSTGLTGLGSFPFMPLYIWYLIKSGKGRHDVELSPFLRQPSLSSHHQRLTLFDASRWLLSGCRRPNQQNTVGLETTTAKNPFVFPGRSHYESIDFTEPAWDCYWRTQQVPGAKCGSYSHVWTVWSICSLQTLKSVHFILHIHSFKWIFLIFFLCKCSHI